MASILNDRTINSDVFTARLRDFLHDCVASAACEEADRVREAIVLLDGAGIAGANRIGANRIDPERVEAMLACGASESAVLAIMGCATPFMLSRGENGSCLASRVLSDGSEELMSEGATLALAMLAAHVSVLLAGIKRASEVSASCSARVSARLH